MGLKPGPQLGAIKDEVYQKQLEGEITSADEARQFAQTLILRARNNLARVIDAAERSLMDGKSQTKEE